MKKLKAIGWAFSLALRFNKKMLIMWLILVSVISTLPAIALNYNKAIITTINSFTSKGEGNFQQVLPLIIVFGIITTLIGLSNRLNIDLIYMMLFDSYYYGMEEVLMDSVQDFSMEELLKKDVNDEYHAVVHREGSLTDFISGFCSLFGKLVGIISLLVVALRISKIIFFISVLYVIGIICLNMVFVEKLRYNWRNIRDKERLAGYYENMPNTQEVAKELRIFESKDTLIKNWKDAYSAIYNYEIKNSMSVELRTFISGLGFYLFLIIMIIYSIFAVAAKTMSTETLLIIFTLCMNIYTSVSGVAKNFMITDHGLYALERQYRVFGLRINNKRTDYLTEPTKKNNIVFETKNLYYSYKNNVPVLKNISIKIKEGETIALVGVNGSGKSTLIKLLLQLYKPESGSLYFYGEDYNHLDIGFLKNKIGVFFQDFHLFHVPLKENVGFGNIDHVDDQILIDAAIEKGGASSIVKKLVHGKDTFIHNWVEKGAELSGGEKQKVAVSRAHMSDKDILIFDEPASMLDPISEFEQFMNINDKIKGRTAILISHRVGFARLADRIILLDKGEVKEEGTHEELMAKKGLYAYFFNEQAIWYQKSSVCSEMEVVNE